jgi:hypothetical protein
LGKAFTGGGLRFCGRFGARTHRTQRFPVVAHAVGTAVLHLGRQRHGACDLQGGERRNLILWARSSAFRAAAAFGAVPPDGYPRQPEGRRRKNLTGHGGHGNSSNSGHSGNSGNSGDSGDGKSATSGAPWPSSGMVAASGDAAGAGSSEPWEPDRACLSRANDRDYAELVRRWDLRRGSEAAVGPPCAACAMPQATITKPGFTAF